jgi:hypothetical protein
MRAGDSTQLLKLKIIVFLLKTFKKYFTKKITGWSKDVMYMSTDKLE